MSDSSAPYQIWHDVLADPRFSHSSEALRNYLELTSGLESPTPYNIWSFISLVAALCGDNIALTHGPMGRERLNLGIILTGVPTIRKSTALTIMQRFAEGLPISYGPTDTAGQRQGIMSAMMPRWQREYNDSLDLEFDMTSIETLSELNTDSIAAKLPVPLTRKASELYFVSKELGRLIASPSRELFDFFTDGMDGESFHYQLKNQVIKIKNPLINLIGATTPQSLGHMMPKGGDTHGFLSRLIFVHASSVTKEVPIPEQWNDNQLHIKGKLHELILDQLNNKHQTVDMSESAKKTYEDLYEYLPSTVDLRLQAYQGRRSKHLLKIAAILAILRGNAPVTILAADIRLSHALLTLTEMSMDRSLFGLDTTLYSKVLCAACEIAESSPDGFFDMNQFQSYAGHLGDMELVTKLIYSHENQGKFKRAENASSQNPSWQIDPTVYGQGLARLNLIYKGPAMGIDEFRSHKTMTLVQNKKGGAG